MTDDLQCQVHYKEAAIGCIVYQDVPIIVIPWKLTMALAQYPINIQYYVYKMYIPIIFLKLFYDISMPIFTNHCIPYELIYIYIHLLYPITGNS